jgi:WD40-like Beta Propeller Repeat
MPASGGEWTRITEGKYWDDKPRFAPDGRTLYFLSSRGGFLNVWGVRFDPLNGKAEGGPFRITNFQSPSQMVSPVIAVSEIGVSAHRMILPIMEVSGSIWVLENVDR